jgi:hypothetical protein
MTIGPLKLYWKKLLVGVITEASWADFPWIDGTFEARRLDKRLRIVLEWFDIQSEAERLEEPPFEPDLLENWSIVKPDRSQVELMCPPVVCLPKVQCGGGGST